MELFISGICHSLQAKPGLTSADFNVWAELPRAVDMDREIGYDREAVITRITVDRMPVPRSSRGSRLMKSSIMKSSWEVSEAI